MDEDRINISEETFLTCFRDEMALAGRFSPPPVTEQDLGRLESRTEAWMSGAKLFASRFTCGDLADQVEAAHKEAVEQLRAHYRLACAWLENARGG